MHKRVAAIRTSTPVEGERFMPCGGLENRPMFAGSRQQSWETPNRTPTGTPVTNSLVPQTPWRGDRVRSNSEDEMGDRCAASPQKRGQTRHEKIQETNPTRLMTLRIRGVDWRVDFQPMGASGCLIQPHFHVAYVGRISLGANTWAKSGIPVVAKILNQQNRETKGETEQRQMFATGYDMYTWLNLVGIPTVEVLSSKEDTIQQKMWVMRRCDPLPSMSEDQKKQLGKALWDMVIQGWERTGRYMLPDLRPDNVMLFEKQPVLVDFREEEIERDVFVAIFRGALKEWGLRVSDFSQELAWIAKDTAGQQLWRHFESILREEDRG